MLNGSYEDEQLLWMEIYYNNCTTQRPQDILIPNKGYTGLLSLIIIQAIIIVLLVTIMCNRKRFRYSCDAILP